MFATASDTAVIMFIIAALCFFALMIWELIKAPAPREKWNALLPLGLIFAMVAFAVLYHQSP